MNRILENSHTREVHQMGYTGDGITVAVLDTGICYHPDFVFPRKRVVGWLDVLHHFPQPYDDNGHGTHVSGILAGSGIASGGYYCGVAPECNLVVVKVLNEYGEGNNEDVIRGIDWVVANKERFRIRIMNISVGTPIGKQQEEQSALVRAVDRAWEAGILVVVAAGNNGPEPGSIGSPGNSRKVITVGAQDEEGGIVRNGEIVKDYSGRGPTSDCIRKPDVVAWGNHIVSCKALSPMPELMRIPPKFTKSLYYTAKNGTSMATPIVAGGTALLLSRYPGMQNREVKLHLRNTAIPLGLPHDQQGWGRIDMKKLLIVRKS